VGGASLVGVAAEFGTPTYVLSLSDFRTRCSSYRTAFPDGDVAYAGKALLTRAIIRLIEEEGLHLDVCSEGELALAASVRFPADRIILHGNAKPLALLRRAVPMGVGRIVLDNLDEIDALAALATSAPGRQRVLLRVTPGVDGHTHQALTTATEDQKFGLSIGEGTAAAAVRRVLASPSLELVGLHCHVGSQISSGAPYEQAVDRLVAFLAAIRDEHQLELPELNLGGGHAIAYHPGDVPLRPAEIAAVLRRALETACATNRVRTPRLTVEPGRAIAGPAGVTLYRVRTVKHTRSRTWVAVNGGLSDNPRPALYGARYTARLLGRLSPAGEQHVTIAGQHCEAGDILIEDALLPADIRSGDLLAVPSTGAYHFPMASNYNLTPRPPLVGVEGGRTRLLVRRETTADLFARDLG
jgi:diaminopimelate decarboxylase